MVTGVANRILYKMALVPLGNYVFFLAQFQTFGYVLVYFAVLFLRRRCAYRLLSFGCRRRHTQGSPVSRSLYTCSPAWCAEVHRVESPLLVPLSDLCR